MKANKNQSVNAIFNELNKERNTLREAVRFICSSSTSEAESIRKFFDWDQSVTKASIAEKCEQIQKRFIYAGVGFVWDQVETKDQIILTKQSIGIVPLRKVTSKDGSVSYKVEYNNYNAIKLIMKADESAKRLSQIASELKELESKQMPKIDKEKAVDKLMKESERLTIIPHRTNEEFKIDKKR